MTTPTQPCPEATYRTRRYARAAAWAAATAAGIRRQEPAECVPCGGWHVIGPQPTTTKGRVAR